MCVKRGQLGAKKPSAIACALLYDEKRVLFLLRKKHDGTDELTLPFVEAGAGENVVALLQAEFLRAAGIDAHVVGTEFTGRHNAGSRKNKGWINAIAFRLEAKSMRAAPAPEFSGFKWLAPENAKLMKKSKKIEWMFI